MATEHSTGSSELAVTPEKRVALTPQLDIARLFGSTRVGLTPRRPADDEYEDKVPTPVASRISRSLNPAGK